MTAVRGPATRIETAIVSGSSLTGAHGFAEQYRLCWGVETAYSNYKSLRPRTTNRNESVRILLLSFPIFIYSTCI